MIVTATAYHGINGLLFIYCCTCEILLRKQLFVILHLIIINTKLLLLKSCYDIVIINILLLYQCKTVEDIVPTKVR